MTNQQIDEVLSILENYEYYKLIDFVDDETLKLKLHSQEDCLKNRNEVISNIMNQIVDEGYEYFYSQLKFHFNIGWLLEGLVDADKIKQCLEDETLELEYYTKIKLLKQVKEVEYIDNIIRQKELNISMNDITQLIISTGDVEYIKECVADEFLMLDLEYKIDLVTATKDIEYINDYLTKFNLPEKYKIQLIISTEDKEYIKACIKNRNFNFDSNSKQKLIESIQDTEYIKLCINDKTLGLSSSTLTNLIKLIEDKEYIKKCIENFSLNLNITDRARLIERIREPEYIKHCIGNDMFQFRNYELQTLIIATNDSEYIKQCIKDPTLDLDTFDKCEMIKKINDVGYIEECILDKELKLTSEDIIDLLEFINDPEYVKQCIKNNKLNLSWEQTVGLITDLNDIEFIKECITSDLMNLDTKIRITLLKFSNDEDLIKGYLKNNKFSLPEKDMVDLLGSIRDVRFIKKIIENKKINMGPTSKSHLVLGINEPKYIKKWLKEMPWLLLLTKDLNEFKYIQPDLSLVESNKKINLPHDMTIGIEIESEGIWSEGFYIKFNYNEWEAKPDWTVTNGVEITSPILTPTEKDVKQIYLITHMLKNMGQKATSRCGGHIHIGAEHLRSRQAYSNLLEILCNTEKILYAISNEEGKPPRSKVVSYAAPITLKVKQALENGVINFEKEEELNDFIEELKHIHPLNEHGNPDRHLSVNFLNIHDEKNTIEFRLANGTIDPDLWIDNINLFGGIVAVSQELAEIQGVSTRTPKQQRKINIFERLKEASDDQKKLEILIELLEISPAPYIKRFESNIGFVTERTDLMVGIEGEEKLIVKKKNKPIIKIDEIIDCIDDVDALEEYEMMEQFMINIQQKSIEIEK